ncbi:hypothetical protein [Sphingomonas sp. SRS2]|uniref:hypothetical protein n=1 Tax=Sphingomonas sp. SRS2 TaxID=133190 RepID=UPI001364918D|nr:hypothetical protein [Sphingomonas sp. SRS2]
MNEAVDPVLMTIVKALARDAVARDIAAARARQNHPAQGRPDEDRHLRPLQQ